MVSKSLAEAGIRGACVHSLRHTFGTYTVKRGTKLREVQEVLGHASLKTTSLYVQPAREDMAGQMTRTRRRVDRFSSPKAWDLGRSVVREGS